MSISRRKFLLIGSVFSIGAIAAIFGLPNFSKYKKSKLFPYHIKESGTDLLPTYELLEIISIFTGSLHGHELTNIDKNEFFDILAFLIMNDKAWTSEYTWLSNHINILSTKIQNSDFQSLSTENKYNLVNIIMFYSIRSKKSRLLALFTQSERFKRRMRASTIPHLMKLYRSSGIPWRNRGYSTWPGVPGDQSEYIRPGKIISC